MNFFVSTLLVLMLLSTSLMVSSASTLHDSLDQIILDKCINDALADSNGYEVDESEALEFCSNIKQWN